MAKFRTQWIKPTDEKMMGASSKTRLLILAETLKTNLRRNGRNHPSQKPRHKKPIFKGAGREAVGAREEKSREDDHRG